MFQLKRNGTCKSIVAMIMAVAMCFSLMSMAVMAAEVENEENATAVTTSTRSAGGYAQRTYTAVAVNETFTLYPSGYDSRAQLTVEIKSIDSGVTSVWMEVISNSTGSCIWSGFIDSVSGQKATRWFNMVDGDTYTVRVNVTGSGSVTVAASLWS